MSYAERHTVTLTTNSSGAATGYTPTLTGRVVSIIYTKGNFEDGVDFTITGDVTGQTIWAEQDVNASKTVAPRQPAHSSAGVALDYPVGEEDTLPLTSPIYVAKERVKIVIADGGSAKTGTFTVIVA